MKEKAYLKSDLEHYGVSVPDIVEVARGVRRRYPRLSPQEREVLVLSADGLTNRQIADRLFLAEKTIKNSVTSVLSKMGMARRREAAVYAVRHGHEGHES